MAEVVDLVVLGVAFLITAAQVDPVGLEGQRFWVIPESLVIFEHQGQVQVRGLLEEVVVETMMDLQTHR